MKPPFEIQKLNGLLEIRDPIHGPIGFSSDELQIIDSPYVQRLRFIKQTGFAELAFPGSTHNRYSHSLGAFHLSGRVFDQIFKYFPFRDGEERNRFRNLLRLSALLHDVGHGPLSHAIEQAMPPKAQVLSGSGKASHEDYTEAIVLKSSLQKKLSEIFGNDVPLGIVSLIRSQNRKPELFKAGTQHVNLFPVLSSVISGELDVDRMDYMLRDSLYCGITYGQFDHDWILSHLTTVTDSVGDTFLALDSRALSAFEDFLLSRYHMYLMVYLHHKSVVYDEMLFQFLSSPDSNTTIPSNVDDYLEVDDSWLWARIRSSANPWAQRILHHQPYKLLLEAHSDQSDEKKKALDLIEDQLKQSKIGYFRSSSTGLLSKYSQSLMNSQNPLLIVYSDPRFTSARNPGVPCEPVSEATELFSRYQKKRIIDRIFAERHLPQK